MKWITALVIWLAAGNVLAQSGQQVGDTKDAVHLDAQQEERALQSLQLRSLDHVDSLEMLKRIVLAVEAAASALK